MKKIKLVNVILFLLGLIMRTKHIICWYLYPLYHFIIDHTYSLIIDLRLLLVLLAKNPKLGITNAINKREPQLIVSLTSYPARIKYIHMTLFSLLSQELKPDKIVLWLAEDEFADIHLDNWELQALKKIGLTIAWTPINTKSFKKLLPALKKYPDACILTADDDAIYKHWWTKTLYQGHLETPSCILGLRALYLSKLSHNKVKSWHTLDKEMMHDFKNKQLYKYTITHNNWLLVGVGGILYPPNSFSKEIFNKEVFQKLCPYADDIWFYAMATLNNTKKRVLLYKTDPSYLPRIISLSQKSALFRINLHQNQNDIQLAKILDYYDLYKLLD